MPRDFSEFLHYKALQLKYNNQQGDHFSKSLEHLIEAGSFPENKVKNVCAKVAVALSDELDAVTALLGMSKRQFIELAIEAAIAQANHSIECVGALEESGDGEA